MTRSSLIVAVLGLAACGVEGTATDAGDGETGSETDSETGGTTGGGSTSCDEAGFQRTSLEGLSALWGDGQTIWATGWGIAVTGTTGAIIDVSPREFAYGDRVAGAGGHVFTAGFGELMELVDGEWIRHDGPEVPSNGLWAAAPDQVWLVSRIDPDCPKGSCDPPMPYAAYWDGTAWTEDTPPAAQGLNDVWGVGANDLHVVGDFGAAFRRLDGEWIELATGADSSSLERVRGNRADNVWAVGTDGTVLKFDGTGWTTAPSLPASPDIYYQSLWVGADDTVYALGTSPFSDGPSQVMRLEADVWMPFGPELDGWAWDVWGDDAALWIAGKTDGPVLHQIALGDPFQTTEQFHIQDLGALESLQAIDAEHAVAVSDLKYFDEYRDGKWSGRTLGNYVRPIATWAAAVDDVFVAVRRDAAQPVGTTFRVQGDEVHEFPVPDAQDLSLHTIWGRSASDVWTGGEAPGGPRLLHFDGMSWTNVEPPPAVVAHLHGDAERLVAATSNGLFMQENGAWVQIPTPNDDTIGDTVVTDDGTIFAVVDSVLHRVQDGAAIPEPDAPEGAAMALTTAPGGLVLTGDSDPDGDPTGFAARLEGSTWSLLVTDPGFLNTVAWADDTLFLAGYEAAQRWSCLSEP